jgi:hypothetical protein
VVSSYQTSPKPWRYAPGFLISIRVAVPELHVADNYIIPKFFFALLIDMLSILSVVLEFEQALSDGRTLGL